MRLRFDVSIMLKLLISIIMIGGAFLSYPHLSYAGWNNLKSPYPSFKTKIDNLLPSEEECKTPPSPPKDLNFTSIYKDKSQGSSRVDLKSEKIYKNQTKVIRAYERQIHDWIEEAITKKNTTRLPINCAIEWLAYWAEENAFLNVEISPQGQAVRKWSLASLSNAYSHIQNTNWISASEKRKIESWLHNLAKQVMRDYRPDKTRVSRNNNHQYWSAWSVMITGVITNDRKLYKWGIQNYKKAMQVMNKDGSLPLELARQSKAFHYHIFATAPLIMIAETAKVNGYNLYKYKQSRLSKLVDLILNDLDNNQKTITTKTNTPQNLTRTITAGQLAWLVIYNENYQDLRAQNWIKNLSPMKQRRIGGNLSALYSLELE